MLYHSSLELIGHTPIVELSRLEIPNNNRIFAKLEGANPAGGVKDRVALHILSKLRDEGKLTKDSIIVEATAGNTGLGIAFVALHFDVRAILVVPDKFSAEKQVLMRALGAEIINTPKDDGMQGAVARAKQILESNPHAISLNQFENPKNPESHYLNTAREIWEDLALLRKDAFRDFLDGKMMMEDKMESGGLDSMQTPLHYFVAGAGSGGSFSGIMRYFREKDSKILGVLCDPIGSIIGGGVEGCANIEGIGNNFIPLTMDTTLIDKVIKIADEEAYNGLRMLASKEGILAGISSGACLQACLKLAMEVQDSIIVTLFADDLSRYFSKGLIK